MPIVYCNLKKKSLVFQFNFIQQSCLTAFTGSAIMERSLRKYSVLTLLKAVETTNLLQHNESVLSGAMKALSRWFRRCWYCRVTVVCSLTAFINALNVVVCCSECQAHLCFYMAVFQSKNTVSNTEL